METQFIGRVTRGEEFIKPIHRHTLTRLYSHLYTRRSMCACKDPFAVIRRKMCGFLHSVSRAHWQAGGHEAVGQKWGAPLLGAIRRFGVGEEEEESA